MPIHYKAWSHAIKTFAASAEFPEDFFYHLGGTAPHRVVEILNERYGDTMDPGRVVHEKEQFFLGHLPEVEPIHEVIAFARGLHGKRPLSVASGGSKEVVRQTLMGVDILGLFDHIITPEQVKCGKPHPEMFLLAAAKMGVEPGLCLVLEDSPTGKQAADAAGMDCVIVSR